MRNRATIIAPVFSQAYTGWYQLKSFPLGPLEAGCWCISGLLPQIVCATVNLWFARNSLIPLANSDSTQSRVSSPSRLCETQSGTFRRTGPWVSSRYTSPMVIARAWSRADYGTVFHLWHRWQLRDFAGCARYLLHHSIQNVTNTEPHLLIENNYYHYLIEPHLLIRFELIPSRVCLREHGCDDSSTIPHLIILYL